MQPDDSSDTHELAGGLPEERFKGDTFGQNSLREPPVEFGLVMPCGRTLSPGDDPEAYPDIACYTFTRMCRSAN